MRRKTRKPRRRFAAALLASVLLALAFNAAPAAAGETRVFLGDFCAPTGLGTFPCEPTLSGPLSPAVDQSTGDVLVIEVGANRISRYHKDGTPSDFSALGTNVIDGAGPGADQTPENGLGFSSDLYSQIAVDNSGTATDGNIYVTQNKGAGADSTVQAIDIFAASGEYLGQITGAGGSSFHEVDGLGVSPCGVAVDPAGNLYVAGWWEDQIYKYDPAANPPTNADHVASFATPEPCSLAAGAGPSAGSLFASEYLGSVSKLSSASGALQYVVFPKGNNDAARQIAVNPADGHVLVATSGGNAKGVREYDASEGSGAIPITIFGAGTIVAVEEASGKAYLAGNGTLDVYSGLVPLPEPITEEASNIGKTSATLNGTVATQGEQLTECRFEYGATTAYGATVPCEESLAEIGTGTAKVHADIGGLAEESVYHFRLVAANAIGPADPQGQDEAFQTASKPQLLEEWAEDVALHEATLKARINPQSAATTYRFEWGIAGAPYEHSTAQLAIGSEPKPQTVSRLLQGLLADTTYHYRVVAENEVGTSEGPERTFITFAPIPPPDTDCPNQVLRYGDSAPLPDCRAYEMVSPVDKNGADIVSGPTGQGEAGGRVQASPDGNKITYTAILASFAGQGSSLYFNQYLGSRTADGWASEGIYPPVVGGRAGGEIAFGLYRLFQAFTPDLCSAWFLDIQNPPAAPEGLAGERNLTRRDNCEPGKGGLESLTPSDEVELPPGTDLGVNRNSVRGASEDGRHVLFTAEAQLTDDAHPEGPGIDPQIYDRFDGRLALVSVLPSGQADPAAALVGNGNHFNLHNAVSADGSRVYWTSGGDVQIGGQGKLYLRLHPEQGIVGGECTKATKACTLPASATQNAFFWQASRDGAKALYSEGNLDSGAAKLFEFDLARAQAEEPPSLVAKNVLGVAGAAEDLSRIYFASREAIAGAGQNGEGDEAVAGKPNLYLAEGETIAFVVTLLDADIEGFEEGADDVRAYSPISGGSLERASRVTPDGSRIAFESRARPTGYDNTGPDGRAVVEVFTYEAGGELTCVSCNPTGGRPQGVREMREPYTPPFQGYKTNVPAAAWIPTWEHSLHASGVLSQGGNRIFFNAFDALLPRDNNGAQDVYEWEAAGTGGCDQADSDYFPQNGGCLYLISSGESSYESEFWEASADGDDVFFTTAASLLPQDPGLIDLYDARAGGGFPQPVRRPLCEGEACQSPPAPPDDPTPASAAFQGAGNLREGNPRRRCPKGKRRVVRSGRARCAKQRPQKRRRANANRRPQR